MRNKFLLALLFVLSFNVLTLFACTVEDKCNGCITDAALSMCEKEYVKNEMTPKVGGESIFTYCAKYPNALDCLLK